MPQRLCSTSPLPTATGDGSSPCIPAATPTHRIEPQLRRRLGRSERSDRQDRCRRQGVPVRLERHSAGRGRQRVLPGNVDPAFDQSGTRARHPDGYTTIDGLQQGGGMRAGGSSHPGADRQPGLGPGGRHGCGPQRHGDRGRAAGFVTVYPCGTAVPTASNINYLTGSTVANLVVSKIGADGACASSAIRRPTSSLM